MVQCSLVVRVVSVSTTSYAPSPPLHLALRRNEHGIAHQPAEHHLPLNVKDKGNKNTVIRALSLVGAFFSARIDFSTAAVVHQQSCIRQGLLLSLSISVPCLADSPCPSLADVVFLLWGALQHSHPIISRSSQSNKSSPCCLCCHTQCCFFIRALSKTSMWYLASGRSCIGTWPELLSWRAGECRSGRFSLFILSAYPVPGCKAVRLPAGGVQEGAGQVQVQRDRERQKKPSERW